MSRLPRLAVPEPEDRSRNTGPLLAFSAVAPVTTTEPPVFTFTRPMLVPFPPPVTVKLPAFRLPFTVTRFVVPLPVTLVAPETVRDWEALMTTLVPLPALRSSELTDAGDVTVTFVLAPMTAASA